MEKNEGFFYKINSVFFLHRAWCSYKEVSDNYTGFFWMRDKTADFRMGQNNLFWKRDKIAAFDNEIKSPILKWKKMAEL